MSKRTHRQRRPGGEREHSFTYNNRRVVIARDANIGRKFRPGGEFAHCVQHLLDTTEPWKQGEDPIESITDDRGNWPRILPATIKIHGESVVWGVHIGDRSSRPSRAPFAWRYFPKNTPSAITVELAGTPLNPQITRIYGGDEYVPPLPGSLSLRGDPEAKAESLQFWRHNAYCAIGDELIQRGTQTTRPPAWYTVR